MQKNLNKMLQKTYLLTCLEVISRVPVEFGGDHSIFNFERVGEATIFTRFPVITRRDHRRPKLRGGWGLVVA